MAVAVKLCRKALSCKVLPGGGNGFRLDVKAQHPAPLPARRQRKAVSPRCRRCIDAEPGVSQPRGEEVLHKLHGRQVGGAAAAQPAALCRKAELAQKASSPASAGKGAVNTVAISLS